MTINKSLISVAAATILAAGFAGCGSSSSTTPTTTSGVSSTATAVKGQLVDGNVTGRNLDGTLYSQYTLGASGVVESNATGTDLAGTTYLSLKPSGVKTYITILNDAGNEANLTTTEYKMPAKGFKYLTSFSTAIADTMLSNQNDYNISDEANVTALTKQVAEALGLTQADLTSTEPKAGTDFGAMNAILGTLSSAKAADFVASLITKKAGADLDANLANIEAAAIAAIDTQLQQFTAVSRTFIVDGSLKSVDMENALVNNVANGTTSTNDFQPIDTTSALRLVKSAAGNYMAINSLAPDNENGFKLNNDAQTNGLAATFYIETGTATADLNNTKATFFAEFVAKGTAVEAPFSKATKIAIELNDYNMTRYQDSKVKFTADTNTSLTSVKVTSTSNEGVSYTDTWTLADLETAAGASLTAAGLVTDASGATAKTTFDVASLYDAVYVALDGNHTSQDGSTGNFSNLGDLVNLADATIGFKATDASGNNMSVLKYDVANSQAYAMTPSTVGSTTGISLFKQNYVDFRGNGVTATNARVNTAPAYNSKITAGAAYNADTNATVSAATNMNNGSVVVSTDTANKDANLTFTLAKTDVDVNEMLNTFTISQTAGDAVLLALGNGYNATGTADINGSFSGELYVTVDSNNSGFASVSGRHPYSVLRITPKDEFTKSGTEQNVTVMINRVPNATTFTSIAGTLLSFNTNAAQTGLANVTATDESVVAGMRTATNGALVMEQDFNITDPDGDKFYYDNTTGASNATMWIASVAVQNGTQATDYAASSNWTDSAISTGALSATTANATLAAAQGYIAVAANATSLQFRSWNGSALLNMAWANNGTDSYKLSIANSTAATFATGITNASANTKVKVIFGATDGFGDSNNSVKTLYMNFTK
ncbi:MAG: hypothetical protein GQ570_00405 [Helicobacteraceae bacterium]|nr:hypothetical protein [Helicobacteraceae bacterium]